MKNIATVLIRVFGFFQCLSALNIFTSLFPTSQIKDFFGLYFVVMLVYFLSGIGIWIFASFFSTKICKGCDVDLSLQHISLEDLYSVAFLAIGLFLFGSNLGSTLNWICFTLSQLSQGGEFAATDPQRYYTLFDLLSRCFLGLLFIFNGRSFSRRLLGTAKKSL
ncbi:MAG: hypothetical protein ABI615_01195 [Chthoniobacterales bacterium]